MVEQELQALVTQIQNRECEGQTVEVKAAHLGCPERLYDTISAFSNQNSGGTFVFGLDERQNFQTVGVYDPQDLQRKVMEYCEQMTPIVRPVFTVCESASLVIVSAEIPPVDISERPCFKTAKGRLQGSYVRVGDADKPMTEYEVYSYMAYRARLRDDIRPVGGASLASLDPIKLEEYLLRRKANRPNLASVTQEQLYELTGVIHDGCVTLAALLLFGLYPQAYFPQYSIIASCIPGEEMGVLDEEGRRFSDSKRIEGTLPDMLEEGLAFVRNNMRVSVQIDPKTGARTDTPQYPLDAVREAILNALVHRDYSVHTEGMPIQLNLFSNRLVIANPGGLYGRTTVDQLGEMQPDTRNPVLITAMKILGKTENRYSGIPRIRRAMEEMSLPAPVFSNSRGAFSVCLFNASASERTARTSPLPAQPGTNDPKGLLSFCHTPRTRKEIVRYLGLPSAQYALRRYLDPLIEDGAIQLTLPDKPRSTRQQYVTAAPFKR